MDQSAKQDHARQGQGAVLSDDAAATKDLVSRKQVKSLYFPTAEQTLAAVIDAVNGQYRGRWLEVPKDQYQTCIDEMRLGMTNGQVQGHSNPDDAPQIIKQGSLTYQQARNVARTGKIDSLTFDTKTQAVTSTSFYSVSFITMYAHSRWAGQSHQDAAQSAILTAVSAGTIAITSGVVAAQLTASHTATAGTMALARELKMAADATNAGSKLVGKVASDSMGKMVRGAAAANPLTKLLHANIIATGAAVIVKTLPDTYRVAVSRSISFKQFWKNLTINVASIGGGSAGCLIGMGAGATIGSIIPIAGTLIGGFFGGILGAFIGGYYAHKIVKKLADKYVDDDIKHLLPVVHHALENQATAYLMTEAEKDQLVLLAGKIVTPKWLRRMYKTSRQLRSMDQGESYASTHFEPISKKLATQRPPITMPSSEELDNLVMTTLAKVASE